MCGKDAEIWLASEPYRHPCKHVRYIYLHFGLFLWCRNVGKNTSSHGFCLGGPAWNNNQTLDDIQSYIVKVRIRWFAQPPWGERLEKKGSNFTPINSRRGTVEFRTLGCFKTLYFKGIDSPYQLVRPDFWSISSMTGGCWDDFLERWSNKTSGFGVWGWFLFLPIKLLVALFWGDCQVFLMLLLDLFEKYFKMPRKNLKWNVRGCWKLQQC